MYPVTDEYQSNIYALSRRILGRVTFDLSPLSLVGDTNTITTSTPFALSSTSQLYDKVRENTYQLATWEQDRTTLDGRFTFASDEPVKRGHTGWVSHAICDEEGMFEAPQTILFTFGSTHAVGGVTVTFDTLAGEYARDFAITVSGTSGVIYTQSVTDNTLSQVLIVQSLVGLKQVQVSITKWSVPNRRARVAEVDVGALLVYDNDRLIRLSTTEEIDPVASVISIPEFQFTIDNTSKEFDMFNPSNIYANLQERQRVVPELGLELANRIEWVPLGTYLLSEWQSDAGAMTATFKARSFLDLLETSNYSNTAGGSTNLRAVIIDILSAAGINKYSIDTALASIVTNGYISKKSCREALQMACMAGLSTVRISRDNTVRVESVRSTSRSESITFDEMLDEPRIELQRLAKKITVNYYTGETEAGSATVENSTVQSGDTIELSDNTLINTQTRALAVAQWIMARRSERKKITMMARGNPATELYDLAYIENRYISDGDAFLTKIDMSYEGYLSARIEGRST